MDIEITSNITAIMPGTVQPGLTRPSPEPRIKQDANGVPDQVAKSDDKISQDANSLSKQVKKEMGNINKQLQAMNYSIRFSIDDTNPFNLCNLLCKGTLSKDIASSGPCMRKHPCANRFDPI